MGPKKGYAHQEDELVTVTVLNDMLEQQKSFFKELMELQEKNFKTFIGLVMDSTSKRVDDLVKTVCEFKHSLEFTQAETESIKAANVLNQAAAQSSTLLLGQLQAALDKLSSKGDYLENQSRRNNILVDGIEDSKSESWQDTEIKLKKMMSDKLDLDSKLIEVERAHRIGTFLPDGRPRAIVAKLLRYKDKEEILKRAKRLKGSKIFINEDFSEKVRLKRKELFPLLLEERKKGNIAYLKYDQLISHPPSRKPVVSEDL